MQTLVCTNCQINFDRDQSQITSSKIHNVENVFCTRSCGVSWNNKHRQKKVQRVSKFEKWLHTKIAESYPNLEVIYNGKAVIESELDVYFPSLKLAMEIQGPSHFSPIFGEEKLAAEQKNDQDKRDKCKELGITLVEVDISKIKEFKRSLPFLMAVDKVMHALRQATAALPA